MAKRMDRPPDLIIAGFRPVAAAFIV